MAPSPTAAKSVVSLVAGRVLDSSDSSSEVLSSESSDDVEEASVLAESSEDVAELSLVSLLVSVLVPGRVSVGIPRRVRRV